MANNKGTITSEQIIESKAIEDVAKLNKELLAILETMNQLSKSSSSITTIKQANAAITQNKEAYDKTNIALKERDALLKKLQAQEERNRQVTNNISQAYAQARLDAQLLNASNKESAIITSKFSTEYQKLSATLNKARRELKDLVLTQGENAAATKKAAAEVQKLDTRLKRADAISGQFQRNVGNYPNSFKAALTSLRGLVAAFGLYSGVQIAKQIYEQVKALDGLNKALLQVTETQLNFNSEQNFLKDLAEESGTNILTLTGAYTKFLASAKTTNLTTEQTRNIFRQTAKAAGVLGLSTEDANGAFRALEQILSKGKVQAEEIRGQLGERLPGAFQILAKSMGLTTAELSKQLELGNVLSEDVLPGFAEELEKTYSLDKVKRVQTLAAEQERLGNSWIQFIKNVEDGDGTISRVLGGALKIVTSLVDAMGKLVQSSNAYNTEVRTDRAAQELELLREVAEETGQSLKEVALSNFFNYTKSAEKAREEVERLKKEQEKILKQGTGLITGFGSSTNNGLAENKRQLELANVALAIRQGRLDAINKILREQKTGVADVTEETEKLAKSTEDLTPKIQKLKIGFEGDTSELEKEVRRLLEPFKDVFDVSIGEDILKATSENALKELDRDLAAFENGEKAKTRVAKEQAEQRAQIFGEMFSAFSNFYGLDLTAFEDLIKGKTFAETDWAATANSMVASFYDGKFAKYDEDEARNKALLDAILSDENASDEKKEQAQKEYDKKERKLQIERAKAAKDEALFQIAISTAVAVVKSLPNYAQAIAVAALGAVQAGIVASKKIPQYYKGTNNAQRGWAWTDERGPEIHTDKHGNVKDWGSAAGARTKFLESGDKIFTASQSKELIKYSQFDKNIKLPTGNIKDLVSQRLARDTQQRAAMFAVNTGIDSKEIAKAVERAMGKFTSRSFNIHNNVTLETPRTRY